MFGFKTTTSNPSQMSFVWLSLCNKLQKLAWGVCKKTYHMESFNILTENKSEHYLITARSKTKAWRSAGGSALVMMHSVTWFLPTLVQYFDITFDQLHIRIQQYQCNTPASDMKCVQVLAVKLDGSKREPIIKFYCGQSYHSSHHNIHYSALHTGCKLSQQCLGRLSHPPSMGQ